MVTYGPCQTPTLGFCVDQAEKIKHFVPESFWTIQPVIKEAGKVYYLKWLRGKIFDRQIAKVIYERISTESEAVCEEIKTEKNTKAKPHGLNTVKMLKVASKTFGLSAHDAMKIAERLYLRGFTTYPRTESTTFSPNFNFNEVLQAHKDHSEWGGYANRLLKNGFQKPRKGVDAGDHPPITPIKSASKSQLGDAEWKLYSFITRNFLACISTDAIYDVIRVKFRVGREYFKLKGIKLVDPGFLEVMPWQGQDDKEIPTFKKGQVLPLVSIANKEGKVSYDLLISLDGGAWFLD